MNVLPAIVSAPLRADVTVSAATLKPTVPFPVTLAPLVTVIHDAPLSAIHPHAAVTPTEPLVDHGPTFWELADSDAVQVVVSSNVFERTLSDDPPGPTAETTAS